MVTQSDEPVPAGYIPVYQNTYNDWLAGRTLVKNMKPETLAKAEKFIKQTKVYPVRRQSMKDQTT